MNLLVAMNKPGRCIQKGFPKAGRAFTKPIKLCVAMLALVGMFSGFESQAHTQADTLMGQGSVLVLDHLTGNPIPGAGVYFNPDSVEMDLPTNGFLFFTNSSGIANYDVITGIDTTVGIHDIEKQAVAMKMFPNPGNNINIFFRGLEQANIDVYSVDGALVSQNYCQGNQFQLNMSGFANGVYFINILTRDGDAYTEKFVKINSPSSTRVSRPDFESLATPSPNFKMANDFTALYNVIASANGYYPDSLASYISQGNNGQFQMILVPLPSSIDTLWGTGEIQFFSSSNFQPVFNVNISFRADTVPFITPDSIFSFISSPGADYKVPVYIGTQTPSQSNGTYTVRWNHPGFYPDSTQISVKQGNNTIKQLLLDPLPPAVINIKFNVAEISGSPITNVLSDSAFVYIKDMQGNKDSAWTVNGVAIFNDVGQNTQYVWGAGKTNMLGWNGSTITTPTGNVGDTITFEIGADLVPDSVYSRKSGSMVAVDGAFLGDLHAYYNVQIGRKDTLRFYLSSSFSQSQVDSATAWIANYGAWTGINTKIENNSFAIPPSNFPIDTGDVSVLGVNITPGTSNCTAWVWSYNNYYVSLGANITNMFTGQRKIDKEIGRINFDEAASSFMSPTGNDMSARDAAHADILYRLDEAYFNGLHSLPNFLYFTPSSTFIPQ